jgi:hypothetical protein
MLEKKTANKKADFTIKTWKKQFLIIKAHNSIIKLTFNKNNTKIIILTSSRMQ